MSQELFTFGYEGLSIEIFISRLKASGVRKIIDVRANPLSRKKGFSKNALSAELSASGIEYLHMPLMGCPRYIRDQYKEDGDWSAYTKGFFSYLETQSDAIKEVTRQARLTSCCLLCFEADFNQCHRTYVGRVASRIGGLQLVHITKITTIPEKHFPVAA